ncbi:ABC transporter permease [Microbacterium aurantiacum]|uniref:ABC transporter permease n=1 Tax=Microbacterium aurantiacum TaxID=162393 RepID=A0AAJ2HI21_9MICO|nr:ABC transporter permease [Microbacterium aurantiacum]MDS0244880.1 ABC transporter permease [Microbacterium aurantiacum]
MTLTSSNEAVAGVLGTPATRPAGDPARRIRAVLSALVRALIVLWGAATAAYLAQLALPGDRATAILNIRTGQAQQRTPEELAPIIAQFGLDDPVITQYLTYLGDLVRGDLGTSYQQFRPVGDIIAEQLGATLALTLSAIALSWIIMVLWVTLTAGRGPRVRSLGSGADTLAAGLPPYWLGILLLLVFALQLRWFPVMGGTGLAGLVLPALTLAIPLAGFMGQATRTEFEKTLRQPFILSARLRGAGDLSVRLRHVLRHAALPALTLTGWALGATISGAVIVEAIFSRPGIGETLVAAVGSQDLPVVTGIVVLVALVYVVANLLVDLLYSVVDPRITTS